LTFLIDTNVASEAAKPQPRREVMDWVERQSQDSLWLSVATISEIDFGIARLAPGFRRTEFEFWRNDLVDAFGARILPIDVSVASTWGVIRARAAALGRTMPLMDALMAATAEVHGLTLVTRNVRDFEIWGGSVFNPGPADPPPPQSA
jgi:hypothetical protein